MKRKAKGLLSGPTLRRCYRLLVPPFSRRAALMTKAVGVLGACAKLGPHAALQQFGLCHRLPVWLLRKEGYHARLYRKWQRAQKGVNTAQVASLSRQPVVSILTVLDPASAQSWRGTYESLVRQSYGRWEWCVAGDPSQPEVNAARAMMQDKQVAEGRVKFVAGDWQAALMHSAGDFVLALDAGSQLAADALFHLAGLLNERPGADIVYFDDDVLDADGVTRRDPFFKPDWSPELLLSVNYLRHAAVRRSLAVEAGGFDATMGTAQEWDLMLRCVERSARIHHLPAILCHRHQREAGPTADDSGPRAVAAHLRRRGIPDAAAALDETGRVKVFWATRGGRVSVIIPTKDKAGLLEMCLTSLDRLTAYRNFEVILVDNGSRESATHRYYERLAADERVRIIAYRGDAQGRFNYSAANNLGARHASGELLLFLNNDIEVLEPDWMTEMVRWAERPEIGMVGATLLFPQGRIQHAGVTVGMGGVAGHVFAGGCEGIRGPFGAADWYRNYLAVTGACIMMRRDVFEGIGRFDEGYQLAFSDIELGLRAVEHGYRVLCTPFARLRHHEGGTRRRYTPEGDILRAFHRMGRVIAEGDPFYNPNLSYRAAVPRVVCGRERTPPEIMGRVVDSLTARPSGREASENPQGSIPADPQ